MWVYCNYGCTCGESPLMFFGEIYIDLVIVLGWSELGVYS